ncbi:MAG: membrane protein insertion efficiency factor YidD [Nitrosomonas sp.]|nr:membrane protein insertion efficiency factor YidD [Nitrosomonas sp.]MCW5606479.1 membrane protein insertion efficiency factor YidD [Nitrosomonas sp.]
MCILFLIRIYQYCVSPVLSSNYHLHPSCSQYALEAVQSHGAIKGGWLAIRRIGCCYPWHPGGHDPVPPVKYKQMN